MSPNSTRRAAAAALAGTAIIGGLLAGLSAAPSALAQPADPSATPAPPPMTADQALAIIARDYDLGSGGGQLSKLIDQVMTLRARGVRPSPASRLLIVAALDKRPNQTPLIEALQATLVDQRKQLAQASVQAPKGAPPVATPGSPNAGMGPNWGPGNPMQQDGDTIFPMPGR
jgi:hypothetical protein